MFSNVCRGCASDSAYPQPTLSLSLSIYLSIYLSLSLSPKDDIVVVIYDKFPKSRVHLLLVPRPRESLNTRGPSYLQNTQADLAMLDGTVV